MTSPEPKAVSLNTRNVFRKVELRIGAIGITMSPADYQAVLHEIDRELAERNQRSESRSKAVGLRWQEVRKAIDDLREIVYEQEGEFFLLKAKPDEKLLEAFLEKYAALMGFE